MRCTELHEQVPPWRLREVARNTGRKCEHGDTHMRRELKDERRRALRRDDRRSIKEGLA